MATTRYVEPKFSGKEFEAFMIVIETIDALSSSLDPATEEAVQKGLDCFDKAIERVGYYREDGAIFKSKAV